MHPLRHRLRPLAQIVQRWVVKKFQRLLVGQGGIRQRGCDRC